ncbi:MAG TPA: carboxypeptidase regulatory-like domain-containing protein, partial [Bryobacteraceae bacterium]|nr:carboxypeptidase regulatory-like domain-containing protein [Bryobacteraceae bacterium]
MAGCLAAQTSSTEVSGLVTDASGAPVAGAGVTLTRLATGETRRAASNNEGIYAFPLIEPGEYKVDVALAGFKSTTISHINVLYQQRARVDVKLELGELAQRVEVSAEARLLNTEDAAVGQNIESKRVVELPVAYRSVGQLALLVPGVSFGTRMGRATGGTGRTSPAGTAVALVAHGQTDQTQGVTLDGVDVKEPRYNTMTLVPSLDAIAEFKVQTAAYSAEYGFSSGAQVQVVMKSGTNAFHGAAFEYLRNQVLDAENYFLNFQLAPGEQRKAKDAFRRNQFGAFLSGPVMLPHYDGRNRTFWSFNYEGRRELSQSVQTGWFPSTAMRDGDFSQLLNPVGANGRLLRAPILIYDQLTGMPFAGNVIPQSRINAGSKNLLQYLPAQQFQQADPLDFTNRVAINQPVTQNTFFTRIDHNISEKDRMFMHFDFDRQSWDSPTINPNFGIGFTNYPTSFATQWVHIFTPGLLNEARFGLLDTQFEAAERRAHTLFDEDGLGIGIFRVNSPTGPRELKIREAGIPLIEGLGTPYGDAYGGGVDDIRVYNFADHVSILRGNHSFKTGFEYRRSAMNRLAANYPHGRIGFSSLESGHAFASLLLGYPDYAATPEGYPLTQPRSTMAGVYFLDDWKITPTLTANIGIRYDYFGVPYDAGGFWRTVDFQRTYTTSEGAQIPTLYPAVLGGDAAVPLWDQDNRYIMPRVGLAWRPSNRWVVRAGSGWYAATPHFNNFTILNLVPPFSGSNQYNQVTDPYQNYPVVAGGTTTTLTTRMMRPGTRLLELGPNLFSGTARVAPEDLWYVQKDRKLASQWTWTFDLQRELPLGTALTVGYVGSKSSNLSGIVQQWNAAPPSSDTNYQAHRPYQYFHDPLRPDIAVRQFNSLQAILSGANAFYHGFTASLDKQFASGLAFGVSYVFSKATGESGGSQDGLPIQNPRNFKEGRGPLPFDRRHNLVVNFVYELPWLRGAKGVTGAVLGGWQVNGIVAYRSGFPFTVSQGDDLNTGGFTPVRPDRIADGHIDDPSRQLWFDPLDFRRVTCNIPGRPDLCHYGSSGVNILNGPSQRNADLSVFKNFRLPGAPESMRLQFRLEAVNALNTPYFGTPNGIGFATSNSVTPDAPRMGEIRSLEAPMRTVQVGLKLT